MKTPKSRAIEIKLSPRNRERLTEWLYRHSYQIALSVALASGYLIVRSFLNGVEEIIKYQH